MRRRVLAAGVALAALALGSAASAQTKSNFAGTWALDVSRSEGLPPTLQQTVTITHEGDKVDMVIKQKSQQGERTLNDVITADGKEGDFTMQMRGNEIKGKRTAKWSADGTALEVSDKANVETPNGTVAIESSSKWTLSDGGKTLTIDQTRTTPRGPQTSKRVYTKK